MEYKDYLEERMIGLYESYNSVILEAHKNNVRSDARNKFVKYLKTQGKDKAYEEDVKKAKTMKERMDTVAKWRKDFIEWSKRGEIKKATLMGMVAGVAYSHFGFGELAVVLFIISWGVDALAEKVSDVVVDKLEKKLFK